MFESLKKKTQSFFSGVASLWHPPENKLTLLLGVATYISLFFLQYPLILTASFTFSTMLLSYTLVKCLKYIYNVACEFRESVKNFNSLLTLLKEKLDKTDVTLNEQFSPAAIELMEQATTTLAVLEAQMPDVGHGIKTAKAFQKSRVGSVMSSLLGVGRSKPTPAATPSSQPVLEATSAASTDNSKKARN